ncbi:MAG: prepilin-type N-terminal cleavage/methylation domain-containing protein [Bacillota bacterium]|nr:prepilin-type N-terminal cleavage/methylation domain-containing protein [Bacillota bacterium]
MHQKGLTLIELLTTLTILFIVSTLIYGVLININKNYSKIEDQNNLEQQANYIISTIKNYHLKNDVYKLSYDPTTNTAFIGTTLANNKLESDDLAIILKIGYPNYDAFSGEVTINGKKPISIYVKLTNRQGQSFETDTIISRY